MTIYGNHRNTVTHHNFFCVIPLSPLKKILWGYTEGTKRSVEPSKTQDEMQWRTSVNVHSKSVHRASHWEKTAVFCLERESESSFRCFNILRNKIQLGYHENPSHSEAEGRHSNTHITSRHGKPQQNSVLL